MAAVKRNNELQMCPITSWEQFMVHSFCSIKHDFQPGEVASVNFSIVAKPQVCVVAAYLLLIF